MKINGVNSGTDFYTGHYTNFLMMEMQKQINPLECIYVYNHFVDRMFLNYHIISMCSWEYIARRKVSAVFCNAVNKLL
jgi:hypothetical protein